MRIAIFTITQNDPWLRLWVSHAVSQGFQPEDIYILDHNSGGTFREVYLKELATRHPVLRVSNPVSYDYLWLSEQVSNFQRFLIRQYDVVVFAAADELLYPTSAATVVDAIREDRSRNIGDYVDAWEVVQQPGEAPYNPNLPWDVQRSSGFLSSYYRRIRVTRAPVLWVPPMLTVKAPFSKAANIPRDQPSTDALVVAHLHRLDAHMAAVRHREIANTRKLKPYSEDFAAPYQHNLITSQEAVIQWLGTDLANPGQPVTMMSLPMIAKDTANGRDISAGEARSESISSSESACGS